MIIHLGMTSHVAVEMLRPSKASLRMRLLAARPLTQPGLSQLRHNVPLPWVQAAGGQALTWKVSDNKKMTDLRQVSVGHWDIANERPVLCQGTCDHVVAVALDLGVEAVEVDVSDHLLGGRALKPALGPEAAKHLLSVILSPGASHLGLRHVS